MNIQQAAKAHGFPEEVAEVAVVLIQGKPYVTAEGLRWKCEQKYGSGNYVVSSHIPSPDEYQMLRAMLGLSKEEPLCLTRGEVWIKGMDRPFVDFGTATPKNLTGFVKFSDYPLEMSSRRATNRAMRLATGIGLTSADELPGPEGNRGQEDPPAPKEKPEEERSPGPEMAMKEQIDSIRAKLKHPAFSADDRAQAEAFIAKGITTINAERMVFRIVEKINAYENTAKREVGPCGPFTLARAFAACKGSGRSEDDIMTYISNDMGVDCSALTFQEAISDLTEAQANALIGALAGSEEEEEVAP